MLFRSIPFLATFLANIHRFIIVITHDNEIAEEAERVIRIRDGKVVEDYINPGYEEKYGRESKKNNKNPIDEG